MRWRWILELGLWVFGVWALGVWDVGAWALGVWVLTVWRVGHSRHFFLHVFLTFRSIRAWGLDIGTWSFGLWHFGFGRLCFGCLSFARFSIECLALDFELWCVSFSLLVSAFRPVFELLAFGLLALGFLAFTQAT